MLKWTALLALTLTLVACQCGDPRPPDPTASPADASAAAPSTPGDPATPPPRRFNGPLKERLAGATHLQIRTNPMGSGTYKYANAVFSVGDPKDVAAFLDAVGLDQEPSPSCPRCAPAMTLLVSDDAGQRGLLSLFCAQSAEVAILRGAEEGACWFVQNPNKIKEILDKLGNNTSGRPGAPEQDHSAPPSLSDPEAVAALSNALGFKLLAAQATPDNISISPLGLSMALALLQAGAEGDTAAHLAAASGQTLGRPRLDHAFVAIMASLKEESSSTGNALDLSLGLWGQAPMSFSADFLQVASAAYGVEVDTLDFANAPDDARRALNEKIAAQTHGNIEDLVVGSHLDGPTRLLLAQATFVKGQWASRFPPAATTKAPFNLLGAEESVEVDTMRQAGLFRAAEAEGWTALELPLTGRKLSIVVLLPPASPKTPSPLTAQRFDALLAAMTPQHVRVALPRFKVAQRLDLSDTLKKLGATSPFEARANLPKLSDDKPLTLKALVHQTTLILDEAGSEAPPHKPDANPPRDFTADRQFFVVVRESTFNTIIALARISNPAPTPPLAPTPP